MAFARLLTVAGVIAIAICVSGVRVDAQRADQEVFADLRADGNNLPELRTNITVGFSGTASAALTAVATSARLNLTYEPTLAGLSTKLDIPSQNRTAAATLLEIAKAASLRVRVSSRGQIVVDALPKIVPAKKESPPLTNADTTPRAPVSLQGVQIQADRPELGAFRNNPSVTTFSASNAALHAVPAFAEPDVLRSVQTLPGVQARSDWTAGFNVRGGESDQTAVLLDGFPVYNPFHGGGLFSAFVDEMVGGIEMHSGALPARVGGRLSGLVDIKSAQPTTTDLSGTISVSFASSSLTLGKAFSDGNGGWKFGVRRTYIDAVLRAFGEKNFPFHFEDGSARFTRSIWKDVNVGITAYGSRDVIAPSGGPADPRGGLSNGLLGVSFSKTRASPLRMFGIVFDSVAAEQRFSLSTYTAGLDIPDHQAEIDNLVHDWRVGGSVTAHRPRTATTIGYDLMSQNFSYLATSPVQDDGPILPFDSLAQRTGTSAAFVEQVWRPVGSLLMNIGARFEQDQTEFGLGFSPRGSIKYFLSPTFAISAGGGRVTQIQHSLGREEEVLQPLQFWVLSDSARGASTVKDAAVRVEKWLRPGRVFQLGAYYKAYDRLLLANRFSDRETTGDSFVANTGTSYGAELLLRELDGGSFAGWVSYTYAYGQRTDAYQRTVNAAQDRRHNLNLVGSWKKTRYTLGARVHLASGLPSTPELGVFTRGYYDPGTQRWIAGEFSEAPISGVRNSERLPIYKRIDLSATRTGHFLGGEASTFLSVVNVLNFKNTAGYWYDFGSNAERFSVPNLSILPTIGIKIVY